MQELFPASSCECTGQGTGLTWSFPSKRNVGGTCGLVILGSWQEGLRVVSQL